MTAAAAEIERLKEHVGGTYEAELEAELQAGNDPLPQEDE